MALNNIRQHIGKDTGITFNVLYLCKSPLVTIPKDLAENIRSIAATEVALNAALPDWQQFLEADERDLETRPNDCYGLTQEIFDESMMTEHAQQALDLAGTCASDLLDLYKKWAKEQAQLIESFLQEAAAMNQENEKAERLKHDHTPAIYNSIKALAEKGVLKKIIEDTRAA